MMLVSSSCYSLLIPWVPDDFPPQIILWGHFCWQSLLRWMMPNCSVLAHGPSDHVPTGVPALTLTDLLATWLPSLQPLASGSSYSCPRGDEASPTSPLLQWQMHRLHPQPPHPACASTSTVLSGPPIMWLPANGSEQTRLGLWLLSSLPSWPSFYLFSLLGWHSSCPCHFTDVPTCRWPAVTLVTLSIHNPTSDNCVTW
jgi:hypothetical protein